MDECSLRNAEGLGDRSAGPPRVLGWFSSAFGADGSLWVATDRGVLHWDVEAGGATLYEGPCGGGGASDVFYVATAPDGSVWSLSYPWGECLGRFDGAWTQPDRAGDDWTDIPFGPIAVDEDGTLWWAGPAPSGPRLLRYDGSWTATELPKSIAGDASPGDLEPGVGHVEVAPDGTVWASGDYLGAWWVARFDGTAWTAWTKETAGLPGNPSLAGIAPDGSAWAVLEADGCAVTDWPRVPGHPRLEGPGRSASG